MLVWAKEQGCPWTTRTSADAAAGGHVEVLRWAREHDCPWDEETCSGPRAPALWTCCGGHGSTAARGMGGRVRVPPEEGT